MICLVRSLRAHAIHTGPAAAFDSSTWLWWPLSRLFQRPFASISCSVLLRLFASHGLLASVNTKNSTRWQLDVQLGLAYCSARLSLHHLLCVAHSLVCNKILKGNSLINWLEKKALLEGVFERAFRKSKSTFRTHKRLVGQTRYITQFPTNWS